MQRRVSSRKWHKNGSISRSFSKDNEEKKDKVLRRQDSSVSDISRKDSLVPQKDPRTK